MIQVRQRSARVRKTRSARLVNDETGGAVVEFAVISVVLVFLTMWSHVFFDIIQVRMKVLESARTGLFELTAYDLTDYSQSKQAGHDKRFDDAKQHIEQDIKDLYGKDLDSTFKYKKNKKEMKRLTLDWLTVKDPKFTNSKPLSIQFLSLLELVLNQPPFKSFNQKGFVSVETRADLKTSFAPTRFEFGESIDKKIVTKLMRQRLYMLVDGWKLEDGCSVETPGNYAAGCAGKSGESLFHKQLERNSYFGFEPGNFNFGSSGGGLLSYPFDVRLASVSFEDANKAGKDGRQKLSVSGGVSDFYTAPFCDEQGGGGAAGCTGPYQKAFDMRGNNFMGCPKMQYDGKESCEYTQQQNP